MNPLHGEKFLGHCELETCELENKIAYQEVYYLVEVKHR